MVNSLKVSLSNLETVSASTVTLLNRFNRLSRKLENNDNLLNLVLSDTIISSQIEQVVLKLDESSMNLEQASADLKYFTETLTREQGHGPINTLLNDSAISSDLKVSIHNIREGTVLLNENLEAMRQHFLFRKYFKKQEKRLEKESKNAVNQE
jgi:phospholipid/cholesterol/gamma-HCH transport system substrate-binding protein